MGHKGAVDESVGLRRRRTQRWGLVPLCAVAMLVVAACDPGFVTPIAGSGNGSGTPGANGPEAQAAFVAPGSVAVSPVDDSVYVVDTTECTISRIANGQVSLVAGVPGSCGDTGDGGPATSAEIKTDYLEVTPDGQIYFLQSASSGNTVLRRISTDGVIHAAVPYTMNGTNGNVIGFSIDAAGTATIVESDTLGTFPDLSGEMYVSTVTASGTQTLLHPPVTGQPVYGDAVPYGDNGFVLQWDEIVSPSTYMHIIYGMDRYDVSTGTLTSITTKPWDGAPPGYTEIDIVAAAADGTVYYQELGYYASEFRLYRADPDGTITLIANENAVADLGTTRYYGAALDQPLRIAGHGAVTLHNGLVYSSGHVVYRLGAPKIAPGPTTTTTTAPTTTSTTSTSTTSTTTSTTSTTTTSTTSTTTTTTPG